jgi:hypothetical protein
VSPDIPCTVSATDSTESPESVERQALLGFERHVNPARHPAVVVHGLMDARIVLAPGRSVTLLSAPGAALFAGCGWWRALVLRARAEYPQTPADDILDCADAPGLAVGALRIGQLRIVLDPMVAGWPSVAAIAASLGGEVLTHRPEALDLANPNAARQLRSWLSLPSIPDDRDATLG